jgi:hypothetical protein
VSAQQRSEVVDFGTGSPINGSLPIGAEVRVARLNSLVAVRCELGRLYREARRRHGRYPDAQTAQRLSSILAAISTSIEVHDLEKRLAALEAPQAR